MNDELINQITLGTKVIGMIYYCVRTSMALPAPTKVGSPFVSLLTVKPHIPKLVSFALSSRATYSILKDWKTSQRNNKLTVNTNI